MKNLFLSALVLASSTAAFAASDYNCKISLTDLKGIEVGTLTVDQSGVGTQAGAIATNVISSKKNIFGKEKERIELSFEGLIMNNGSGLGDPNDYTLKGTINRTVTTDSWKGEEQLTVGIGQINGSGDFKTDSKWGDFGISTTCQILVTE